MPPKAENELSKDLFRGPRRSTLTRGLSLPSPHVPVVGQKKKPAQRLAIVQGDRG